MDVVHGDRRVDEYFWMRDRTDPEVAAYLEAENAYADAVMKPTEPFQAALYREMLGRIQETDLSVPYREAGYFYYSRTEEGRQYPILCRKQSSLEAPEEVTLDLSDVAAVGRQHAPTLLHVRPGQLESLVTHAAPSSRSGVFVRYTLKRTFKTSPSRTT